MDPEPLSTRTGIARRITLATAACSRALRLGDGSTIGGRFGLLVDPELLSSLGRARVVALVSGTNGKTTTTRLLAEALGGPGKVATSSAGANMPAGLVRALAGSASGAAAVLEVDEGYLAHAIGSLQPKVIVLLNLSRDQLDRVSEVRMIAARWKDALQRSDAVVVANADDPLVVWAASSSPAPLWVAAGGLWHADAFHCPVCDERVGFDAAGWSCVCGLARPAVTALLDNEDLVFSDGTRRALPVALPGRFNLANAAMAIVAARALGVDSEVAQQRIATVTDVAGRFAHATIGTTRARLMLAKNPAGWTELLSLVASDDTPVVIGINAQIADGRDPSWLWDVPFEMLSERRVVATGERATDLAVRLRHADVAHLVVSDPLEAIGATSAESVDFIGNYTSFQDLRRRLPRSATVPTPRGDVLLQPPRRAAHVPRDALRIVVIHPDLLGTYGDVGNGRVLANRATWRGVAAELIMAMSDEPLPEGGDLYCLGGGEDGPQAHAAQRLQSGALRRAIERGAVVFGVCAGYQILGQRFVGADGSLLSGVGLLDVETARRAPRRAVGEVRAIADEEALRGVLGELSGFENHAGLTTLGPGARPFARVLAGVGNGDGTDGARLGRVLGTYLHGPALARNPALADYLLSLVEPAIGRVSLDDTEEDLLRSERLANRASLSARLLRSRTGR